MGGIICAAAISLAVVGFWQIGWKGGRGGSLSTGTLNVPTIPETRSETIRKNDPERNVLIGNYVMLGLAVGVGIPVVILCGQILVLSLAH